MAHKHATSVIYVCSSESQGDVQMQSSLLGKKVTTLCGSRSQLTAIVDGGIIDIMSSKKISDSKFSNLAFGIKHSIALSNTGVLYSWGFGEYGELGLGSKIIQAENPTEIKLNGKVVDISSGDYHSCAIDDKGNMYSWGQNFDRQLGLYNKTKEQMRSNSVCYIEDIILIPRFLPFSVENKINKVSCGSKFTVAITNVSEEWA